MTFQQRVYQQAKLKTKAKKEVIKKVVSLISVGGFLVCLNIFIGGYFWAKWPLLGMGIGLFFSVVKYLKADMFGLDWEDKHITDEMQRMYDKYDIPVKVSPKEEVLDLNSLKKEKEPVKEKQTYWNKQDFV